MEPNADPGARAPRPDEAAALREWAFSQFPIGISVYDEDGRLVKANDEMLRLTDRTAEEMVGRRLNEFLPVPPFDDFTRTMERVLGTGEPVRTDTYFRPPGEARERAWATFFTPLTDEDGRTRGVSLAALDVTDQYRAQQRLALVNDAGVRIGTTLDAVRTSQELAEWTAARFAHFVAVDLLDTVIQGEVPASGALPTDVTLCRTAQRSADGECRDPEVGPGTSFTYPAHSPLALALASGRPSLHRIDDPGLHSWLSGSRALPVGVRERGVHSVLIVPLRDRDTPVGLALFVRHPNVEPFDEDDLLLAEEIASRTAVCIANARRYAGERTVAVTLQRSLLPGRLPSQGAVEVTSRYLPAGAQAGVGGDWFDVIPLSGARVALVVGDVVGHGLQASATMGRLRAAVRTLADIDLPPDELLTHLDDLVLQLAQEQVAEASDDPVRALTRDMAASCLYAVYDPVTRRCVLARAGHPAPVVVDPDGSARVLDVPGGPTLGLGGLPFESLEVELAEGSLLALYTDGLLEEKHRDVGEGLRSLCRVLSRPAESLDQVCDEVLAELLPGQPADDIALLLARTRALDRSRVRTWELTPDPATVAEARKNVAALLEEWGLGELAFTTELVVSELVTNAIRHAVPPLRLRLIRDHALICEVSDGSSTSPRMRRARSYDEGGRGLLLVAQLSRRWGTRFTTGGKTIWSEQPFTPPV
ncbi:SpoIIE family protein phosphatase [Streptomyces orinoci]|uniref:SpoIIE family protein phosphatase n=1 Tax=Streptomyces orinoci TaxID=67339 RepID=A0ABV3JRN2_STRON|nr:SpoIIE family protein phosphatase [Streptomyces orinoci]